MFHQKSILLLVALLAACQQAGERDADRPAQPSFETAFSSYDTITLQELASDSIADIGVVLESVSGDLVIADRLLPRIRRYAPDGTLKGWYGRFGSGPGEFESIDGLAENGRGEVYVVDRDIDRITVLTPNLELARLVDPSQPLLGPLFFRDEQMLLGTFAGGRGGHRLALLGVNGDVQWRAFPSPEEVLTEPYWGSVARSLVTTAGDRIFTATSILYPIREVGFNGEPRRTFGDPPPSFEHIPEVERGAFAGGARDPNLSEWLDSFTVMGGIFPVAERHLVVVHSRIESNLPVLFQHRDYAFDVYRLEDGVVKMFEDVALPTGARVLSGGRYLYVLLSMPPDGWTILRAGL